jgi:hypothetical protein
MIALVATLIAKCLLISVREPSVPWQKVASVVNLVKLFSVCFVHTKRSATYGEGLLDVSCHEIIITILATGAVRFGSLGRKFGQTLYRGYVVPLLGGRKRCPKSVSAITPLELQT